MHLDNQTLDWLIVAALVASFSRFAHYFQLFCTLAWPGTLAHEAAHWLVALLLNGKPAGFSVWPSRHGGVWTLGLVVSHNSTWFNQAPIALAPLLWLPGTYVGYERVIAPLHAWNWQHGLALYMMATIVYGSIPSVSDWHLAVKAPFPLLLLVLIGVTTVYW